jgi:hypothetical protein
VREVRLRGLIQNEFLTCEGLRFFASALCLPGLALCFGFVLLVFVLLVFVGHDAPMFFLGGCLALPFQGRTEFPPARYEYHITLPTRQGN